MTTKEYEQQQEIEYLELELKATKHLAKKFEEDKKVIYDAYEKTQRANKTYFTILKENGLI